MSRQAWILGGVVAYALSAGCGEPMDMPGGDGGATGVGGRFTPAGQGGSGSTGAGGAGGAIGAGGSGVVQQPCTNGMLPPLVENRGVYASSNLDVWTVKVTAADTAALANVNANMPGAQVNVIFQEDGVFGDGVTQPNATMELRGASTRGARQKSYQITLGVPGETWRGFKKINLNKHPYDLTRVRNKLAFDTFATVPHFTSLRTQFVHLYVNGQDYGLYTQIEAPNGRWLTAHGLDPEGTVYKPTIFYWGPIDPAAQADPVLLDEVIEGQENPDLPRLLRTIADVNDAKQNINDVIARHFNRDNYLTWLAVNVLTGNFDTITQNYILYSPSGCQGWYFTPWDYDGALEFYQQPSEGGGGPRYRAGLANWWSVPLFQRFVRDPNNLRDLDARITELHQRELNDATAWQRVMSYYPVVRPMVTSRADVNDLPTSDATMTAEDNVREWEGEYARLNGVFARRYAEYRETLTRPMPVWLGTASPGASPGDAYTFTWARSHLLMGGDLSYDFELSVTPSFAPADIVVRHPGLRMAVAMVTVPPGTYYWRVIIRPDAQPDNWQSPFGPGYKQLVVP